MAAVVSDGPLASGLLVGLYAGSLLLVCVWRPFGNSWLFFVEALSLFINLLCLILQWIAAVYATNNLTLADMLSGAFLLLQVVVMVVITGPVYIGERMDCPLSVSTLSQSCHVPDGERNPNA